MLRGFSTQFDFTGDEKKSPVKYSWMKMKLLKICWRGSCHHISGREGKPHGLSFAERHKKNVKGMREKREESEKRET